MDQNNSAAEYFKAPVEWNIDQPNPFTTDGAYGIQWSVFEICDRDDDRHVYRRASNGLFCFLAGRKTDKLESRLADFLYYERTHGRKVILSCPADITIEDVVKRAIKAAPAGASVRQSDPQWVVHSTPLDSWQSIRESGALKSFARLQAEGVTVNGVGFHELGEPNDFAEHVMLGGFNAIGPENVVASQTKGYIFTEQNTPYTPGVRLYFDAHRIIRAGLVVRDGLHTLKVRNELPLCPYFVTAVTVAKIDPSGKVKNWTPKSFLERANAWFTANNAGNKNS